MPGENTVTASSPTKLQTFFKRLLSTVLLWVVVLGALFSGNRMVADIAVLVVMNVICWFGLMEFCDMVEKRGRVCFRHYALVAGAVYVTLLWLALSGRVPGGDRSLALFVQGGVAGVVIVGLLVRRLFLIDMERGAERIAYTVLALVYVPWLLGFIQEIYFWNDAQGAWWLLFFILVSKSSDMGAYAIGSLIGKHKMIPRISPGKTWEGFFGAIVVTTGVSLAFAHFAPDRLVGMTLVHAGILGVLLGVGSVVGDLVESLFKRESGVKDSGSYFPGIGGILDLVDSLLFNAPIMYAYIVFKMISA